MSRWIPTSKGASSIPQSSGDASAGLCFGFGPTAAGQAMARVTMAVVLVVVALFLAFMLVPEAVVAVSGEAWDADGSPAAARVNRFKAKADDRSVPVADDRAVPVADDWVVPVGAERAVVADIRGRECVVATVVAAVARATAASTSS
jgi:hypothetical protein